LNIGGKTSSSPNDQKRNLGGESDASGFARGRSKGKFIYFTATEKTSHREAAQSSTAYPWTAPVFSPSPKPAANPRHFAFAPKPPAALRGNTFLFRNAINSATPAHLRRQGRFQQLADSGKKKETCAHSPSIIWSAPSNLYHSRSPGDGGPGRSMFDDQGPPHSFLEIKKIPVCLLFTYGRGRTARCVNCRSRASAIFPGIRMIGRRRATFISRFSRNKSRGPRNAANLANRRHCISVRRELSGPQAAGPGVRLGFARAKPYGKPNRPGIWGWSFFYAGRI